MPSDREILIPISQIRKIQEAVILAVMIVQMEIHVLAVVIQEGDLLWNLEEDRDADRCSDISSTLLRLLFQWLYMFYRYVILKSFEQKFTINI